MRTKAFTLIELLVVVAIIGILAAVGVVAYNGYTGAAKIPMMATTTRSSIRVKALVFINFLDQLLF
jgi:prepilin-type N-terminal cleavage/methylation domain-containing protein